MRQGLMQEQMLLISSLLEFAERYHPEAEVISRRVEGDIHRCTWVDIANRARQVAQALDLLAMPDSACVGTLAWNGYRHLELYYGVSGSGRVLHTINPRLHPDQVAWIINHANDQILCFDLSFLPLVQAVHERCPNVSLYVAMCGPDQLPQGSGIPGLVDYETWILANEGNYRWPIFDERAASCLCYTSGTTGDPKGVLYSHRSTVLHAYAAALPDSFNISARDVVLPVVPMFHVNAWGIAYIAAMTGCKLVLPGPALDGASIHALIEAEEVSLAAGVPTVWQMLLTHVQSLGLAFTHLKRTIIGGAACPPAMIATFHEYGVEVLHAWGMTELSPLGTVNAPKRVHAALSDQEKLKLRHKQGRPIFGVDMKIVSEDGNEVVHDGKTNGDLYVKGPWVVRNYFESELSPLVDGWFPTGDIAVIDADGYMEITDRSKDVIKSGGEWISSIEIENVAMAHPSVQIAACIGVKHPKWDERPLLVVVLRPGADLTREELLRFFEEKVARWQVPDDIVFQDSIPIGPTGKILKTRLREQLRDYALPET